MKYSLEFILGIVYITIWVGMAIGTVGQINTPSVYSWELPIVVFIIFLVPFYFGIMAGRKQK